MATAANRSAHPFQEQRFPLVSVAVVCYQQERHIEECLSSIEAQDYPNVEIVIADDCSSDDTVAKIQEFARSSRHLVRFEPAGCNVGITANHNRALLKCEGKYISWIAGDDVMLPEKIGKQVELMESDPDCAVCYHDMEVFDSSSGKVVSLFSQINRPIEGGLQTLLRGAVNAGSSNMVRRSCSPSQFDERIPHASDWLYYMQCLLGDGIMRYLPEVLGRYRRHDGNTTARTDLAVALIEDHLLSCDLILAERPDVYRAVNHRRALILRALRWRGGKRFYRSYLRASLASAITPLAAAGYAASLFGIRR